MNRAEFLTTAAVATAVPLVDASGITADIEIRRDASDLLVPFTIAISVTNSTTRLVGLDFPTSDIYRIDVRHDGKTVWSTATGHKPLQIARRVDIGPGVTRLASQIVDGTTDDRRAYEPGLYTVHVALLGTVLATSTDRTLVFAPPISIADARASKGGTVVTIAGVPDFNAGVSELRDASGSLQLSRPLGLHPSGNYVVRGYLDAQRNDVQFAVGRFAPAFDNIGQARPTSNN